jgi:hypothetical protein
MANFSIFLPCAAIETRLRPTAGFLFYFPRSQFRKPDMLALNQIQQHLSRHFPAMLPGLRLSNMTPQCFATEFLAAGSEK